MSSGFIWQLDKTMQFFGVLVPVIIENPTNARLQFTMCLLIFHSILDTQFRECLYYWHLSYFHLLNLSFSLICEQKRKTVSSSTSSFLSRCVWDTGRLAQKGKGENIAAKPQVRCRFYPAQTFQLTSSYSICCKNWHLFKEDIVKFKHAFWISTGVFGRHFETSTMKSVLVGGKAFLTEPLLLVDWNHLEHRSRR